MGKKSTFFCWLSLKGEPLPKKTEKGHHGATELSKRKKGTTGQQSYLAAIVHRPSTSIEAGLLLRVNKSANTLLELSAEKTMPGDPRTICWQLASQAAKKTRNGMMQYLQGCRTNYQAHSDAKVPPPEEKHNLPVSFLSRAFL